MSRPDADLDCVEVTVPPALAVQLASQCGPDPSALPQAMQGAFTRLMAAMQQARLVPAGPPRAIYLEYGLTGTRFLVAVPIAAAPHVPITADGVSIDTLPSSTNLRFTHRGPYALLSRTYDRIGAHLRERGLMTSDADWQRFMPMWEEYLNDPARTAPEQLVTHIFLPAP